MREYFIGNKVLLNWKPEFQTWEGDQKEFINEPCIIINKIECSNYIIKSTQVLFVTEIKYTYHLKTKCGIILQYMLPDLIVLDNTLEKKLERICK